MLAAIQRLAEDAAGAHGEAALQKLAAIRSICQAGLAGDAPSELPHVITCNHSLHAIQSADQVRCCHIAGRMYCFGHITQVNHVDIHSIHPPVSTAEVPKPASVILRPSRARAAASRIAHPMVDAGTKELPWCDTPHEGSALRCMRMRAAI